MMDRQTMEKTAMTAAPGTGSGRAMEAEGAGASADREAVCATRLRAVSDPTRLKILRLLQEGGRTPGELARALALAPNLLSHHLRVLRESGFVAAGREGRVIRYRLARPSVGEEGGAIDLGCCRLDFS